MSRTQRFLLVLFGAGGVLILAGMVVWFNALPGLSTLRSATPPQTSPISSDFTLFDKPAPLPEIRFTTADGNELSIFDFHGRIVLLNLWATWCVPCRKEMPTLDRLEARLGGPDFEVIALSIDRQGLPVVKPFFAELGLKALNIYLDPSGKTAFTLNAPGLPTTILIDSDGREIARKIGPAEWDSPEIEDVIRQSISNKAAANDALRSDRSTSENVSKINADEVAK